MILFHKENEGYSERIKEDHSELYKQLNSRSLR